MSLYYYKHEFVPNDMILELYFTGCSIRCKNCQNWFLQERTIDNTREVEAEDILREVSDYVEISTQVHILGGEPLEQDKNDLISLLSGLKRMGFKNVVFFTGRRIDKDYIKENFDLFKYCDYVKGGEYDETLKEENGIQTELFPLATRNQYLIKVKDI